jgi:hypothetical protein
MLPTEFPHLPFTAQMAAGLGASPKQLERAVANREVRRVLQGVFVSADAPDTIELRAAAANLVLPPHLVLCDRTAAWLHGVDVLDFRELDVLPPLDTFALRDRSRTIRPQCRRGQRDLLPEDICIVNGVAVTAPLRTSLDLGCLLVRRRALAALDAFRRKYGFTQDDMRGPLPRYFRRRGVLQLRQLIPLTDGRAESQPESWARLEIVDAGLPSPVPQFWVTVGGRPVFRLDLAYPHAKVAIEYDGREFHEGDEQREADERRRAWLRQQGWVVIVLDKDSFTPEAVAAWVSELRTALRRRA